MDGIQPAIERNQLTLATLLESHRESLLFWNELIKARMAHYNAKGQNAPMSFPLQLNVET
jgi:hypothetical protein